MAISLEHQKRLDKIENDNFRDYRVELIEGLEKHKSWCSRPMSDEELKLQEALIFESTTLEDFELNLLKTFRFGKKKIKLSIIGLVFLWIIAILICWNVI